MAHLVTEPISKVRFEIEDHGSMVELIVVHDGFSGETEMYKGISGGWQAIIAKLKTLLETGVAPDWQGERPAAQRNRS